MWHLARSLPDAMSSNPYLFGCMRIEIQVQ
jgi:hypothetical protein